MTDIVERLREEGVWLYGELDGLREEAAKEIERLRHENTLAHKLIDEMTDERSEALYEIERLREQLAIAIKGLKKIEEYADDAETRLCAEFASDTIAEICDGYPAMMDYRS